MTVAERVSKRDEQVRADANDLLNACASYAKRMLRKYGEFAPFGYRINADGDAVLEPVAQSEMPPDPALLLGLVRQQLAERARKGLTEAVATASNVTVTTPSAEGYMDAVMIEIEHKHGYRVDAFVPYTITGGQFWRFFPRVVRFGKLRTQEGTAHVFAG
jgi:hypothetical protein